MFGSMGWTEIIVIGCAALLLFGPKRLPELAKNLGKGIRDFKKALDGTAEEETPKEKITTPDSSTKDTLQK